MVFYGIWKSSKIEGVQQRHTTDPGIYNFFFDFQVTVRRRLELTFQKSITGLEDIFRNFFFPRSSFNKGEKIMARFTEDLLNNFDSSI